MYALYIILKLGRGPQTQPFGPPWFRRISVLKRSNVRVLCGDSWYTNASAKVVRRAALLRLSAERTKWVSTRDIARAHCFCVTLKCTHFFVQQAILHRCYKYQFNAFRAHKHFLSCGPPLSKTCTPLVCELWVITFWSSSGWLPLLQLVVFVCCYVNWSTVSVSCVINMSGVLPSFAVS